MPDADAELEVDVELEHAKTVAELAEITHVAEGLDNIQP